MSLIKQKGILDADSDPYKDADVIMTAAILGWAWLRLKDGKPCRIDVEVPEPADGSKLTAAALQENPDYTTHQDVAARLNTLLIAAGLPQENPKLDVTQYVLVGRTPVWTVGGRVTGGTGDKPVTDSTRYDPPLPQGLSAELYNLATNPKTSFLVGYQGRGAYTGFIAGRSSGQTALMPTYRHIVPVKPAGPDDTYGRRWHPSPAFLDSATRKVETTIRLNAAVGPRLNESRKQSVGGQEIVAPVCSKVWGFIGDWKMQDDLAEQGMYFDDRDPFTQQKRDLNPGTDIVGYTHGMVQAIYDVQFQKLANAKDKNFNPGTPYEIAVGKDTTKLASCFPCSLFMEATGYPASSTHLGRGESWIPLYPATGVYPASPQGPTQHQAITQCNEAWEGFCARAIQAGLACLEKKTEFVTADHQENVKLLRNYLRYNSKPKDHANLFLDACTVHDSEYKRVLRTLNPPAVAAGR